MRRKQLHIFADKVAAMLLENPRGLSSYEIYNRLADDRSNMRWLPARNTIGSRLSNIIGVEQIGSSYEAFRPHDFAPSKQIVMWRLNIDRFNEWRFGDEPR